ncbi:MAG TPA: alpha/beta hydrolase [Polyangiaceae bacterium]|nr:alpha/beta hydrolase [Polyangiaceae bacterium]
MTPVLILPGIGGSGAAHWQSRWEVLEPTYRRVEMPDWDRPELDAWLATLDAAVKAAPAVPVIVAHSLGCLAVAHWAARGGRVRAALLVAVPDPAGPLWPDEAASFAALPTTPLGFPTHVVASRDDPYGSFEFAKVIAHAWGSAFVDAGAIGHINAASALGDWPFGRQLLARLLG